MKPGLLQDLLHLPRLGRRTLPVWRRHLRVWSKAAIWSSVLGELAEPIIWLFGLGFGLGAFIPEIEGSNYLQYVAPGVLAMGVTWTASFENTYGSFTRLERQKTYSAVMLTPVTLEEVVAADLLFGATKAALGGTMMLLVLGTMGLAVFPSALWVIPLAALIGFTHGSISLTVTALSPSYDFFTYYFTLFLTPLMILSGVWFPVDSLPPFLAAVSEVLPLTHGVRAARVVITGGNFATLLPSLLWLCLYSLVFFTLSANLIRRRLIS